MDIKTPLQEMVPEQIQDSGGNPEIISAIKEPFEKKPKLSVWKIVIPVVMLLVLLGGLVAYSLSPKAGLGVIPPSIVELESPSSVIPQNWLTYTNAKYEFSIDYPADWIKTDSPSGDGATFEPQKSNESPELSEDITLYVGQKTMTEETLTFEKYAKVAAIQEIQNYNSLASIEQLTLSDGTIGYKTTWMVQSLVDPQGAESESAPITYFEIPGMPTQLLRINSGYDTDPAVYDRMIKSVVFTKVSVSVPTDASPAPSLAPVVNEKVILAKYSQRANFAQKLRRQRQRSKFSDRYSF